MKFCPTCEARYDEEILRFCTKDGTPLVDENQPNFTEMPSENLAAPEEDPGEETMVRYKPPKDLLEPEPQPEIDRSEAPRIVISTSEEKKEQNVRPRVIPPYQPLPQKPNTGKVVLLTILGTIAILVMGVGLFLFLRNDEPSNNKNLSVNTNPPDTNMSTNLNYGGSNLTSLPTTNLSSNSNFNVSYLSNTNANLKTPTPTPKPSPSPSPSITANTNVANILTNNAPPSSPRPTVTATPKTPTPTPNISPTQTRSDRPPSTPDPKN